jgi:carboxylesterase type B
MLRAFAIAVIAACFVHAADSPVVHAPAGAVRGEAVGDIHVFRGLPYAAAPVGSMRWKAPVAATAWQGVREAVKLSAACYQPKPRAASIYTDPPAEMNEDCLFLNVWTPANARNAAVLVGFNSGEIRSLRFLAPPVPASGAAYTAAIRQRYGSLADAYLKLYPASNLAESILAEPRDALYGWTAERVAVKQTAVKENAFLYLFGHGYPAAEAAGLHGFHASELPFVFGTADKLPPVWPKIDMTPAESKFTAEVSGYWVSFVKTGTPGAGWPAFGSSKAFMDFAEVPRACTDVMPGMYELQEEVVCRRRAEGKTAWNWNVGIVSPVLPQAACK